MSISAQFTKAVGDIPGAHDTGITREGLYKALDEQGNSIFATFVKVAHALGLQFNLGARSAQG
jgi:probable addiction module antidote protein